MKWVFAVIVSGGLAIHSFAAGFRECIQKMGEADLAALVSDTNAVCFRFTILPTWGNPVCIRIQQEGQVFRLITKRLEGQAGYQIGKLVETKARILSDRESRKLLQSIKVIGFFEMSATKPDEVGFDGETWYLEGLQRGKFHKVERWSAGDDTKKRGLERFVEFCALLVKTADLEEPPKNKGHEIFGPKK